MEVVDGILVEGEKKAANIGYDQINLNGREKLPLFRTRIVSFIRRRA